MEKSYFDKAAELINDNLELAHFGGPKPDDIIREHEDKLGVRFPESYRNFLRKYGGGGFGSYEFYGIHRFGDNSFSGTYLARKLSNWPDYFISIYGVGEGTEFVIDTSKQDQNGECPIVAVPIQYEQGDELELIASSFGEFFYNTVKAAIERKKKRDLIR